MQNIGDEKASVLETNSLQEERQSSTSELVKKFLPKARLLVLILF